MAELDAGTADPFDSADLQRTLEQQLDGTDDTGLSEEDGATAEDGGDSTDTLDDPATWPEELKPYWSRMSKVHNERLTALRTRERGLKDLESKADIVDKFYNDPAYAKDVITNMAQRLGLSLDGSGAVAQSTGQPSSSGPDAAVLELAQQELADQPDLQFLAPAIAKVANAIVQRQVAPLEQREQQSQEQRKQAEYAHMASTLSEAAPGWEQHEDEMLTRLAFLRNAVNGTGPMTHPKYGTVLGMLHQWTTGKAQATAEAASRMQRALNGRTTTGTPQRSARPSVQDQIAKADGTDQKWEIAFRDALQEVANTR